MRTYHQQWTAQAPGSDPIRMVSGHDRLHPISDEEEMTLEDICGVEPGEHRLTCLARVTGPVTVEIVG